VGRDNGPIALVSGNKGRSPLKGDLPPSLFPKLKETFLCSLKLRRGHWLAYPLRCRGY
jgi:hypothetical protein